MLADWLSDTTTTGYLGVPMDTVDIPAVPAHRTVTIDSVKIVSGNVGLGGYSSFGARRIAAEYTAGRHPGRRPLRDHLVPRLRPDPVSVSVAMPITMPSTTDAVLSSSDLAAATAVDGTLTQQLDAAEDHNVAVAVDPRIIASIRLLGENAPSSARTWLTELETLRNETFALPWADADTTGLRQAGAETVPTPISLDQLVKQENFPGASTPTPTPTPSGEASSGTPGSTPTPTETSSAGPTSAADDATAGTGDQPDDTPATLPTTQTLLDFPWSIEDVAWPAEGTVASADLPALAASGATTTILASGNTSAGTESTIGASERIGSQHVLVADQSMSALLRRAANATGQQAWATAMSDLTATWRPRRAPARQRARSS